MKCFNCNSEIGDNSVSCPICGTNLLQQQNNVEKSNNAAAMDKFFRILGD